MELKNGSDMNQGEKNERDRKRERERMDVK